VADSRPWHKRRALLLAYTWATLAATAVFLSRGIVQATLYEHNATGWLAVARIAMSYPLFIAAVGFSFWVVQRARRRVVASAGEHGPA
jgi:TRAP-type C4-dicarboxylate transport system permease small subunit